MAEERSVQIRGTYLQCKLCQAPAYIGGKGAVSVSGNPEAPLITPHMPDCPVTEPTPEPAFSVEVEIGTINPDLFRLLTGQEIEKESE